MQASVSIYNIICFQSSFHCQIILEAVTKIKTQSDMFDTGNFDDMIKMVEEIFSAGLRPKGFVVVHEAPKLLPAPAGHKAEPLRLSPISAELKSTLKTVGTGLGLVGAALVAIPGLLVVAGALLSLAAVVAVPALLLVGAVIIDPVLVAVTEDGWWIEIDRWDS